MKSSLELRSIASSGGNLIVDANNMSSLELRSLASTCKQSHTTLTINNASKLSALECRSIASLYPSNVTFNFC